MGNQSCTTRASTPCASHKNVFVKTKKGYLSGQSANDPYFEAAVNAARTRTHQIASRHGLSPAEREDFQQELMLDLLQHRGQFDPSKGSPGTFTGLVSKNRAVELLDALIKQRVRFTDFGAASKMMRAANDAEISASQSQSAEDCIDAINFKRDPDHDLFTDGMATHDLNAAIAFMNGDQSALLDLLTEHSDIASACAASGISIASFYRRVHDLRMHLRMFGLREVA
jgi:DNA-directed RNA polymerase specialized sigma24 family protein